MGSVLEKLGKKAEADQWFEKALSEKVTVTDDMYKRYSVDVFSMFDTDEAGRLIDDIEWLDRGSKFMLDNDVDRAIYCFNKAIEINPQNPDAWFAYANALHMMGKLEDSLECYKRSLEIRPKKSEVWYNMGNVFMDLKQLHKAISCYDKALALKEDKIDALANKGTALKNLGRIEEAVACYEEVLKRTEGKNSLAWFNLANAYDTLGEFRKAVSAMDKALILEPNNAEYWYNKGVILYEKNKLLRAKEAFDKALAINPKFREAAIARDDILKDLRGG
jgi:tetratricopeptide (TPR) repeat protein